jgi:SRSO17 transposase
MITAAVQAGLPASWVAGDEVYGADPGLRQAVRKAGLGYVLQVASNRRVPTGAGMLRVDEVAANLPDSAWEMRSAGPGSKGERLYSWAFVAIDPEHDDDEIKDDAERGTGEHLLLVRRNDTTGELAYHRCYTPQQVPLSMLVHVAG